MNRTNQPSLSGVFLNQAADALASQLSGAEIIRSTAQYAVEWNVSIPHASQRFNAPNKRTALAENLQAFTEQQRYQIIGDLLDHPSVTATEATTKLRLQLATRYAHLNTTTTGGEVDKDLLDQTQHWLEKYPEPKVLYTQALEKYHARALERNVLDDLRLAFERLLRHILKNNQSLEHQIQPLGSFVKARGGSPEFANMFVKIVEYYAKYQNTYVKHDNAVIAEEIELILELTAAFMKHIIRLAHKQPL